MAILLQVKFRAIFVKSLGMQQPSMAKLLSN
jgi:hypothetical protein